MNELHVDTLSYAIIFTTVNGFFFLVLGLKQNVTDVQPFTGK